MTHPTAAQVHAALFAASTYRDPRSQPYKDGVLDALRLRMEATRLPPLPYALCSAECDEWLSGLQEGLNTRIPRYLPPSEQTT